MTRPTLLITRPMPAPVLAAAREIADVTVAPDNTYWRRDDIGLAMTRYDAILPTLGDTVDKGAIDAARDMRCRLLANFGVGFNHIDVEAARARGVAVTNTPGAVTDATADIAMTLLLMTARRAAEGERLARSGTWAGWHPTQMLGTHVTGKTLGIIGYGRIGQAVARRGHYGFGMDILFFNRSVIEEAGIPGARQVESLCALMAECDFVSVNVPGGAVNRHLVDADALAAAKPGLILVNTARGDVIDEAALIAALQAGTIAGAGLDVYENEPTIPKALRDMENVVLLPHMGTSSLEVRTRMGLLAVENVRAFFAGETPPNLL
jgi:lactate dehydrogenase-like 2-hydroxyacid dehydrogenase